MIGQLQELGVVHEGGQFKNRDHVDTPISGIPINLPCGEVKSRSRRLPGCGCG